MVEYNQVNQLPAETSFFIHMRLEVPFYRNQITKEDYNKLPSAQKHAFMDGIFDICGVTDAASTAHRVWIQVAPSYSTQEVQDRVVNYLRTYFGKSTSSTLPGSGVTLRSPEQRRSNKPLSS